jgi:hypothetical protein
MTSQFEHRLYRLEQQLAAISQQLASLSVKVQGIAQQQYAGGNGNGGGGGGGGTYFGCTLSEALGHGLGVGEQTVWKLVGGVRTNISTDATIYNDGPVANDDIPSGSQAILGANDDGSYTATGIFC